jgi:hypothetical protein
MKYKDFFEYNDIQEEGKFRISPSSFSSFYENSGSWYKQNVLKENTFKGNTATVVGTILHARIGAYWTGVTWDTETEMDYIAKYDDNPEVDCWKIADLVANLWDIVPDHLSQMDKPIEVEQEVKFSIPNSDYILAGTFDYLRADTIGDIKTISQTPKAIKVNHRIQILIYELIRRMNGLEPISKMEVLYLVKTKKPKIVTLVDTITEDDITWIKAEVKNMIKRLDMAKEDDSMVELLFPNNPMSYM